MTKTRRWTLEECDESECRVYAVIGKDPSDPWVADYEPSGCGEVVPVRFVDTPIMTDSEGVETLKRELKTRIDGLEDLLKKSVIDADYHDGKLEAFSEVLRAVEFGSFKLNQIS